MGCYFKTEVQRKMESKNDFDAIKIKPTHRFSSHAFSTKMF